MKLHLFALPTFDPAAIPPEQVPVFDDKLGKIELELPIEVEADVRKLLEEGKLKLLPPTR